MGSELVDPGRFSFEIAADTVFKKIVLFPKIKFGVEFGRQMLMHFHANRFRKLMKLANFVERRFIKRAANEPRFVPITEQIALAEVLQPDQTFLDIVIINSGRMNPVRLQKLRDLDVMAVFFALEIVFYQNDRLLG